MDAEPAGEIEAEELRGPVLIVDDDARVLSALASILRTQGYAVVAAASGKEALRYLKHNPPPRVILSAAAARYQLICPARVKSVPS